MNAKQQDARDTFMPALVITSVGTNVGKTLATAILCRQLTLAGRTVRAVKPVVSGFAPEDPSSDPALILRSLGRVPTPSSIAEIAPWRFKAPLSPHLAARKEGVRMNIDDVANFCRESSERTSDGVLLIEGAGGVMSPIDDSHTGLDLIDRLGCPAILVTGTYLGVLSHSLTALAAIRGRGIVVKGIVVSESEQSAGLAETVECLGIFSGADIPLLALPRLHGSDEEKWLSAPSLIALCTDSRA